MLTKKNYKIIAEILAQQPAVGIIKADLVENLAAWLQQDNPRFDRKKFEEACFQFDFPREIGKVK